jgi:hypothetical protein
MLEFTNAFFIATHKNYSFPCERDFYPVVIGENSFPSSQDYLSDSTGENISKLNPNFCELTLMYWMWKNVNSEYCGLFHYRRYFLALEGDRKFYFFGKAFISSNGFNDILEKNVVILPKKRNYFIISVWTHYKISHVEKHLHQLKNNIENHHPEYIPAFNFVFSNKKISLYNMFCMNKIFFDEYCEWLFDIIFRLFEENDLSNFDDYQKRFPGFLAERLFNVWLHHNKTRFNFVYRDVANIEKEYLSKKIYGLISNLFRGK